MDGCIGKNIVFVYTQKQNLNTGVCLQALHIVVPLEMKHTRCRELLQGRSSIQFLIAPLQRILVRKNMWWRMAVTSFGIPWLLINKQLDAILGLNWLADTSVNKSFASESFYIFIVIYYIITLLLYQILDFTLWYLFLSVFIYNFFHPLAAECLVAQ